MSAGHWVAGSFGAAVIFTLGRLYGFYCGYSKGFYEGQTEVLRAYEHRGVKPAIRMDCYPE